MNETIQTILNRRSVRKYQKEQIPDEDLKLILKAGSYAPSGLNQQSVKVAAIQNPELLKELADLAIKVLNKTSNPFYDAPTVVVVFAEKDKFAPINDGCLALENMFLAAASLGIASCWVHAPVRSFNSEEGKPLKEKLGIGDGYIPVGSCILGYADGETPRPAPRREDFAAIFK